MFHPGRLLVPAGLVAALAVAAPALAQGTQAPAPDDGAAIVGGIPTHLQPTTGALLFVGPDTKNQFLDCSGVLIGCRTVLTAAHCICKNTDNYADCVTEDLPNLDVADLRFFFQHSGIHHVRDVYIHPAYVRDAGSDLAILRLSEKVEGIEPAKFQKGAPTRVPDGTEGIVAGFGKSGDDRLDAAIKRVGNVVTDVCPLGTGIYAPANICWNFDSLVEQPGDDANLCEDDDGGPLFADFGRGPEVAGIHGGGGPTCEGDTFSYSTSVVRSSDWIEEVGGLDVTRDQCNVDVGEVGEPWVTVKGGSGNLPRSEDEARFVFDIPKDSRIVRVTVNGDTEKSGDYDLFVGLGTKQPTRFDNDCEARGVGQFGVCKFQDPNTPRVNVLVRHVRPAIGRGRSRFQVTVTAYQDIPPAEDPPRGPDDLRYEVRGPGLRRMLWIDDSDNEAGFQLERRMGTDPINPFSLRAVIDANKQSYLEAIADDVVATYRLRAFNAFGFSEWSNLCVVNKPRIEKPTRLRAPAKQQSAGRVFLKWNDNSDNESFFELQRRPFGSLKWRNVKLLPPDTTEFTDTAPETGDEVQYRIRARGNLSECIGHSRFNGPITVSVP